MYTCFAQKVFAKAFHLNIFQRALPRHRDVWQMYCMDGWMDGRIDGWMLRVYLTMAVQWFIQSLLR